MLANYRLLTCYFPKRRVNGESDFKPDTNEYPFPPTPPINHTIAPKFVDYFASGIEIKQMTGILVNFNYPDDNSGRMFSNIDASVDLKFDLEDDRSVLSNTSFHFNGQV